MPIKNKNILFVVLGKNEERSRRNRRVVLAESPRDEAHGERVPVREVNCQLRAEQLEKLEKLGPVERLFGGDDDEIAAIDFGGRRLLGEDGEFHIFIYTLF